MLLEQGPGCVWALRQDLTFHCVYGHSAPLFGIHDSGLAGRNLHDILPPERRLAWRDRVARVFRGETVCSRERAAAGLFTVTCFPLYEGGEIAFAGGTAMEAAAFHAADPELRHTAIEALETRERERTRLARFLHNEVGQCLSAAGLLLDLLRMDLERVAPEIRGRTAEVQQVLERVMERVREFSQELDPAAVERAGLYPALDRLVGRLRREFPGTLRLMADSSLRLEAPVANAFYRIAEQALDNAVRHARPPLLEVHLKLTGRGPVLEVRDNGAGFDVEREGRRGLGLLIMEHCAAEVGLELAVSSLRGRGTTVRAMARAAVAAASD
jgi:signal transduction histidine kinase